jgi:predicted outer membrane repeat protein
MLTVTNSTFSGNSAGYGGGGGIHNDYRGRLTVTNSTFSGNSGSGIANYGRRLMVTNTTFSGNSAGYYGGGIFNYSGRLTVTNSTFSGNSADLGGGIFNIGRLAVTNSTFSGNSAGYYGGGIYGGRLTVTNSTFSGNSAASDGGGIYNDYGSLTVTNSTFSGNSAGDGGGIYGVRLWVTNTIIANSASGGNCGGAVKDGGHNLDDGTTCGFKGTGCATTNGTSLCNAAPNLDLAGLASNGGPTQTIAVESGSPAIGAAYCRPSTDQRGYWRAGTGTPTSCTSGAYEFGSPGCPSRLTACGTLQICTNIQKDIDNCGACGNACAAGQKCSQGTCM